MKTQKQFSVVYTETIEHEAIIEAGSKAEAIKKVKCVLGDDLRVVDIWELHKEKKYAN